MGQKKKKKEHVFTGVLEANPRGFAFVSVENIEEDFFISRERTGSALQGDTVEIEELPQEGKRREAKVVRILKHGLVELVGTYERAGENYGFVRPDNPHILTDFFVPIERSAGACDRDKVVMEITSYAESGKKPEGRILEILGSSSDPRTEIDALVKEYALPVEFSEKILNQAERVGKPVSIADRSGRKDLRDWQTVTIDGEDARDLDDAVSLMVEDGNYILGVHIADVANYVQEHSALDEEAKKRGTSVYLVDRVIPMLPPHLSNGICSLNEGEDRLTLSCIMTIDRKGNILSHEIAETVICSKRRMTYTDVNRIITFHDPETCEKYADFVELFERMDRLARLLRAKRKKRGSIDFDFPETKVVLDDEGYPIEIGPYERNPATKIIEEFMLAANETVAQEYYWLGIPFLYRTHENPDPEKIRWLGTFIQNFGLTIRTGREEIHPKEIQKLLYKIEGTPSEPLISRLTLRSMKQARYTVECSGHFGLAAKYYCHFTSPIRRYPDLQIHRIIKENLRGRMKENRMEHYEKILPAVAQTSSELERRAQQAERESVKIKKVEYMEERIGEVCEGVISGITKYGIYVELPDTIEGMISVASLPGDYFHFLEDSYEMVGEHTGKRYRLGETVRVRVTGTDRPLRRIDFEIVEEKRRQKS